MITLRAPDSSSRNSLPRLVLVAAWFLSGGCTAEGEPPTVRIHPPFHPPLVAMEDPEPIPETTPKRIVCMVPSLNECLFALGLWDRVVGVDRWSDQPPEARSLPKLGDLYKISIEPILDLKPDLVILDPSVDKAAALLRESGLNVVLPETAKSSDGGILELSRALGIPNRGERLVEEIQTAMAATRVQSQRPKKPRVLVVFERHPQISVATETSFFHDLLETAAAESVSAKAHATKPWVYVSLEQIVDWKPEVILDLTVDNRDDRSAEEAALFWKRALSHGASVHVVRAPLLSRPGPRLALSAAYLARVIHGE